MLNSERALYALNDMDEKYLESTRIRLGYRTGEATRRPAKKRIIAFALAAALLRSDRETPEKTAPAVDYVREAYLHPAEEVRITFDKQLRTGLWSKELFDPYVPTIPPFNNNEIILEVKYNHSLPTYIRDILGTYCQGACPSAISKYTWCRRYEGFGEE